MVGLASRAEALRAAVGLLPAAVLRCSSKASFNEVAFDRHSREFVPVEFCRDLGLIAAGGRRFYQRISALENLFARMRGMSRGEAVARASEVLEEVGLAHAARRRVGLLSQGMQKRLTVACGLLDNPPVLVVDETTHDLDPEGADQVMQLVRRRAETGVAVLWATQRLDEIRGFAHRDEGVVRFVGTVPELTASITTQRFLLRVRVPGADEPVARLQGVVGSRGTVEATSDDEHVALSLRDGIVLGDVLASLVSDGVTVLSCREEESLVAAALLQLTRRAPSEGTR